MVRVKAKKPKGDDAFVKRKQKVGRKKLAPATTTRAEVHARTLRLSTSTAMNGIMSSSSNAAKGVAGDGSRTAVLPAYKFAELLAMMRHYRSTQRASALFALTRMLECEQKMIRSRSNAINSSVHVDTATFAPDTLTALEKLRAFNAMLEAMTDTEEDVRQAALRALDALLSRGWLSPTPCVGSQENESENAYAYTAFDTHTHMEYNNNRHHMDSNNSKHIAVRCDVSNTVHLEHAVAVLQTIHITLTHALKSVCVSGVLLLRMWLHYCPRALLRRATRVVCRRQHALVSCLGGAGGSPTELLAGNTAVDTIRVHHNNNSTPNSCFSHGEVQTEYAKGRHDVRIPGDRDGDRSDSAGDWLQLEEEWIMSIVRRVASLTWRTVHVTVLADLLEALLPYLALTNDENARITGQGDGAMWLSCAPNASNNGSVSSCCYTQNAEDVCSWHRPQLIRGLLDDLLPRLSNAWKELMELRLQLFRQEEKLASATALARVLAVLITFLKVHENATTGTDTRRGSKGASSRRSRKDNNRHTSAHAPQFARLLSQREVMHQITGLLFTRVPVTMTEILHGVGHGSRSDTPTTTVNNNNSNNNDNTVSNRVDFALALIRVCAPLADSERAGWRVLSEFFDTVFVRTHRSASCRYSVAGVRVLVKHLEAYAVVLQLYVNESDNEGEVGGHDSRASPHMQHKQQQQRRSKYGAHKDNKEDDVASDDTQDEEGSVFVRTLYYLPYVIETAVSCMDHCVAAAQQSVRHPREEQQQQQQQQQDRDHSRENQRMSSHASYMTTGAGRAERMSSALSCMLWRVCGIVSMSAHYSLSAHTLVANKRLRQALTRALCLLPRLLFTLRQTPTAPKSSISLTHQTDDRSGARSSNARVNHTQSVTPAQMYAAELVPAHVIDAVVHGCLRVLWFVCSSGHPLLTCEDDHDNKANRSPSTSDDLERTEVGSGVRARAALRQAWLSVFGLCTGAETTQKSKVMMEGVLARCRPATIKLAQDAMYYLGVRGSDKLQVYRLPRCSLDEPEETTELKDDGGAVRGERARRAMLAVLASMHAQPCI